MVQFRKSKKVGPFRFTLTPRGISTSAGAGPIRVSRGADGKMRRTISVPGTGVFDTKVVGRPRLPRTTAATAPARRPYERAARSPSLAETVIWSGLLVLCVPGYAFLGWLILQLASA